MPELRLHELRAEKYNGLVRLLKPGCRTIILITDMQSRPKLIPGFHKAVWPYRKWVSLLSRLSVSRFKTTIKYDENHIVPIHRNKTLMFAHMLMERGQPWFTELLRLSLLESRDVDLQINPRNCVGTVLSLNGHRKYFCMYHAKHPETIRGAKVRRWLNKHYRLLLHFCCSNRHIFISILCSVFFCCLRCSSSQ